MTIENLINDCKRDYFKTRLEVGKIVDHPEHGPVQIISGCFWDPTYGRLSNWWVWRELINGNPVGKQHSGYGWM